MTKNNPEISNQYGYGMKQPDYYNSYYITFPMIKSYDLYKGNVISFCKSII